MEITYGHRIHSMDDEYVKLARNATVETVLAGSPGSMLVDFFPVCKWRPSLLLRCASSAHLPIRSEEHSHLDARSRLQAQRVQGPRLGPRPDGCPVQYGQDCHGTTLNIAVRDCPVDGSALQASGNARPCFTASLLEEMYARNGMTLEEEDDIKGAAGVIYAGSSPSVVGCLHTS